MAWNPEDTPVRRMLDELAPGERREHKRSIEPTGKEGRFWEVAMDGNIMGSSLIWVNDEKRPSVKDAISMTELPVPLLEASDEESPIGDFYRISPHVYLFADSIIACIRQFDPQSIEIREAIVQGTSVTQKYWLTLVKRSLDAIDVDRTNLTLDHKRVLPDRDFYSKLVYFHTLVLRENIPPNIHCFADVYSGRLFFSTDLVACARNNGARWFYARHPTGLSDFPE